MTRDPEVRLLRPVLLALIPVLLLGCGEDERGASRDAAPPKGPAQPTITAEQAEALRALGYLAGAGPVPEKIGVTVHDEERAYQGYNLVTSGHAPEASLIDMNGTVLNTWHYDGSAHYDIQPDRNFWVNAHLMDNGDLLAIFDPHGIVKIDKDSNLIWATDATYLMHHDLFVTDDGLIYVLGKRAGPRPEIHETKKIIQDLVVVLDAEGNTVREFSILDAYRKSPDGSDVSKMIREATQKRPKWLPGDEKGAFVEDFHANSIEVFDGSLAGLSPFFKKGNLLLCSPRRKSVFIVDGRTETVVWNWFGQWTGIHRPVMLDTGTFLLFHNDNKGRRPRVPAASEVLEYDFSTRELVWSYRGDPAVPGSQFYSFCCGAVYRMPNGNTLIVVTGEGRAIEVTHDGEMVWEFVNPDRAGDGEGEIASLFLLERLPRDTPLEWLAP